MTVSSTFLASDGNGYERLMGRWSRRLAPKFAAFASIEKAERVLDVGCGTGSLTTTLAENDAIAEIQGIDFSAAYVEHATRANDDPRVYYSVGDACALPFDDGRFDFTLAMLVLQFVPQADKAVTEMCRVTGPGGTVAAATWDQRGGYTAARIFWDTAAAVDPAAIARRSATFLRPVSLPGDLERAWKSAGLVDIVADTLAIRMDYASFQDYWDPLEGSEGPYTGYIHSLTPEMKTLVKDKVRAAYEDGQVDGPRSYSATAWVVKGKVLG